MPPGLLAAFVCLAIALPGLAHAADPGQAGWAEDPIAITLPANHAAIPTGQPRVILASTTLPAARDPDAALQTGLASWYGGRHWAGRRTASGRRFNPEALTAASPTLPLGSRVWVTLVATARSVLVTITDRQGTGRRIIDLSHAAARQIGLLGRGVAQVVLRRG